MRIFERIGEDLYLLKVPFGAYWTGVAWIKGNENILIDSGPSADMVDEVIPVSYTHLQLGHAPGYVFVAGAVKAVPF